MFLLKTQIRVLEEHIQHMENERSPREADLIDDQKLCEKNKTASAQEGDADQASGADADGREPPNLDMIIFGYLAYLEVERYPVTKGSISDETEPLCLLNLFCYCIILVIIGS